MNRLIQFAITCCFSLVAFAANPSFNSFDPTQFDVRNNRVALTNGLSVTNIVISGTTTNLLEVWDQNGALKFFIDTNGYSHPSFYASDGTLSGDRTVDADQHRLDWLNLDTVVWNFTPSGNVLSNVKNQGTNVFTIYSDGFTEVHGASPALYGERGSQYFWIQYDYLDLGGFALLKPHASAPNYVLGTSTSISSGNLLEVKNNGTNKFVVPWDGAVQTTSLTISGGLTNTANSALSTVTSVSQVVSNANGLTIGGNIAATYAGITNVMTWALSDMTTALTTGTNKNYWYAPAAGMTIKFVRATVALASSSGTPTFDINEAGTSILSTKITIDANEFDSDTAATPPVISDSAIAARAKVDFDIDVAGTAAAGAQIQIGFTVP